MRAKVVRSFIDRKAGAVREEGAVFELSKERFAEIAAKLPGYIAEAPSNKEAKPARKSGGTE